VTEPNNDPATGEPTPDGLGALTPPPVTSYEGQQYPPPTAFPPPPGTQYGTVQYGAPPGYPPPGYYGQPNSGPYNPGPYNPGPYGYPQGYYAQPQGTSGMAIASLVLGICGFFCVTPFIGIGLGIGALTKISKTGQPGKGMAIAGIILSSAWILLLVLAIVTGHFTFSHGTNPGPSGNPNQGSNGTPA
jgi:hypothetical protein